MGVQDRPAKPLSKPYVTVRPTEAFQYEDGDDKRRDQVNRHWTVGGLYMATVSEFRACTVSRATRRAKAWRGMAFVAVALLAAACSNTGPITGIDDLADAVSLWNDLGPNSYAFAIERQCFCSSEARGPVRITVINGQIVAQIYVDSGASVTGDARGWFPDVDGLFDVLRDAMNEGAHEIRVTYNPVNGVPIDFWIDYSENMADEELGFIVTESVQPAFAR